MKTARLLGLLGVGLVAGAAFAINVNIVGMASWFKGGVWVMPTSNGAEVVARNKITSSYAGQFFQDFASVGGGQATCALSGVFTVTGVDYGDNCSVTSNLGQDGGAPFPPGLTLACRPQTNAVRFQLCNMNADAGTEGPIDLSDAGFFFTTFGHR